MTDTAAIAPSPPRGEGWGEGHASSTATISPSPLRGEGRGEGYNGNTVVLGIGNVLWADEGFGPKAVTRLRETQALPHGVEAVDGGTQGLYLLPLVQSARRLLVFDTVDFAAPPGQVMVLRDREIPAFFGQRPLSLHQTGFSDVLAAAELTGRMPLAVTLVGVQLERIDEWGGDLSATVAGAMDSAIAIGMAELAAWANGEEHEQTAGNG